MSLHLAFQLTPRLRDLLDAWDAGVRDEGPLARHSWTDIALWPAARSATVAGGTGIEGNPLRPEDVDAVRLGSRIAADRADIQDVLDYNDALDLANTAALRTDFEWSQELLRRLNATILADLEDDEQGEYRRGPVTVGGSYHPPGAAFVPGLMRELVEWLNADDSSRHTLVLAGLTHLNVVSIHPWLNGNGRTARVAGSLALMRRGISAPELVNVESWIRAHAPDYAAVLQETHGPDYRPDEHSATPWLEYFATISVDRLDLRNRLFAAAQSDIGLLGIELTRRGEPLEWPPVLLAAAMGPVSTTTIADGLGRSTARTRAILAAAVSAGWLAAVGDRRGRRYVASDALRELPLRSPELMERLRNGSPLPT